MNRQIRCKSYTKWIRCVRKYVEFVAKGMSFKDLINKYGFTGCIATVKFKTERKESYTWAGTVLKSFELQTSKCD